MKKLLREPLLHFLVLASLVFVVYHVRSRDKPSSPTEILVTQGTIQNLATTFTRLWNRPPGQDELKQLIQEYVREEICTREAIALGLDRDDTVIRRRLRQKLEFLFQDVATQVEPGDSELRAYLDAHPQVFQGEPHFTFRHVYLNPDRHASNLSSVEAQLQKQLHNAGAQANAAELGDPFMLSGSYENAPASDLNRDFGKDFAARLAALPVGQWSGPVESGYGLHFVFLSAKTDGSKPKLNDVRDAVRREVMNAKQVQVRTKFYDELTARYTIKIEPPQEETQPKVAEVRR